MFTLQFLQKRLRVYLLTPPGAGIQTNKVVPTRTALTPPRGKKQ